MQIGFTNELALDDDFISIVTYKCESIKAPPEVPKEILNLEISINTIKRRIKGILNHKAIPVSQKGCGFSFSPLPFPTEKQDPYSCALFLVRRDDLGLNTAILHHFSKVEVNLIELRVTNQIKDYLCLKAKKQVTFLVDGFKWWPRNKNTPSSGMLDDDDNNNYLFFVKPLDILLTFTLCTLNGRRLISIRLFIGGDTFCVILNGRWDKIARGQGQTCHFRIHKF
ncbi:hypothetical protein EGR_02649 [Echinococcus granulosus]|uniref:Uncharacterized protein n=1 Tax=Echinococcus granulosus TaxID=6210 RepID=W6UVU3_ECHGR|nr:hypothetical protein EGR_02649 [Echinococcus granulosus]EUB62517.1 hypothetical protein EGR_02649 [Echinococcus granulosus]